jgi:hypothetical protein
MIDLNIITKHAGMSRDEGLGGGNRDVLVTGWAHTQAKASVEEAVCLLRPRCPDSAVISDFQMKELQIGVGATLEPGLANEFVLVCLVVCVKAKRRPVRPPPSRLSAGALKHLDTGIVIVGQPPIIKDHHVFLTHHDVAREYLPT